MILLKKMMIESIKFINLSSRNFSENETVIIEVNNSILSIIYLKS